MNIFQNIKIRKVVMTDKIESTVASLLNGFVFNSNQIIVSSKPCTDNSVHG